MGVLFHHFHVCFALLLTGLTLFVFFFLVEITDNLPEPLILRNLVCSLILPSHKVLLHVQGSELLLVDQFLVLFTFLHLHIPILHRPHLQHLPLLLQLRLIRTLLRQPTQLDLLQHLLPELCLLFELVCTTFFVLEGLLLGVEFDDFCPLIDAAAGVEEVADGVERVHRFVVDGLRFVADGVVSDRVIEFPPRHFHFVVGESS